MSTSRHLCALATLGSLLATVLVSGFTAQAAGPTDQKTSQVTGVSFHLPSSATLSTSSSSSDTRSGSLSLHLMLPKDFWIALSLDSATEKTETLETKTTGGSLSLGTDPLAEYTLEMGIDVFGVADQYRVQEGRARVGLSPDEIVGITNPGIELGLELRTAHFSFTNSPNAIFTTETVELQTHTSHIDVSVPLYSNWSLRVYAEKTAIPAAFNDLNRPLAPLVIPESAISTAVSWVDDEGGASIGYSNSTWGARAGLTQKHSAISGAITSTSSIGLDYRWSRAVSTGLRLSSARSLDDPTLDPVSTAGADLTLYF